MCSVTASSLSQSTDSLGDILRKLTIFSSDHIQSLDLQARRPILRHLHRGILLLLQKQHSRENSIQIDLQQLVPIIDMLLELVGDLDGFGVILHVGVDEDGVGVTIHDLQEIPLSREKA